MSQAPLAFTMVANAAACDPRMVQYSQLWEECSAGRLSIDPGLVFDGAWLLDHAIATRAASTAGQAIINRSHGADPDMDRLWAMWAKQAPEECLGDREAQNMRLAKLLFLGSSQCLDALLGRIPNPSQADINHAFKQVKPALGGMLRWLCRHDFRQSMQVLLERGMAHDEQKSPLFLRANSAQMGAILLDGGAYCGPDLMSRTLERGNDLPIKAMKGLTGLLVDRGMDEPGQRLSRMATGLHKKRKEQLDLEASLAGWSYSSRGGFSPVFEWASRCWGREESIAQRLKEEGSALAACRQRASHGRVIEGESMSDARAAWLAFFPSDAKSALKHANVAQDIKDKTPAGLLDAYADIAVSHGFGPSCVSNAAIQVLASLADDPEAHRGFCKHLAQVQENGRSRLVNLMDGAQIYGHVSPDGLVKSSVAHVPDGGMSALCALGLIHGSPFLLDAFKERWRKGCRPAFAPEDVPWLSENASIGGRELLSYVQQSIMDLGSPSSRCPGKLRRL